MIQTLYVHRPLLNASDVLDWAVRQGFAKTLHPDDMHVTIAFSKKALPWRGLKPHANELHIVGDKRAIIPLGEKGATVLQFFHPHLHQRWQEILSQGASWEHDGYRPHVTLTYAPHDLDLQRIKPYSGPLIFGAEKFAPVVLDWDEKIREIPLVAEKQGVLTTESSGAIKYSDSIKGNYNMTESLASLLVKNIDLILEAFNVDEKGNLVEVNKKKVQESDNLFHQYFVKSMNHMYRTINEADPIMHEPNMMEPMGSHHGMHQMGHGHMGHHADEMGMGTDDMLGDMAMGDMHDGAGMGHMGGMGQMGGMDDMDGMGQMGGMEDHDMPPMGGMGGPAMESADGDYDWVFGEDTDLDIDSLFNLSEEDHEEEDDDERLDEFGNMGMMDDDDDQMAGHMGGSMDMGGGANDFGGDMGGAGHGDMDLDSGMDHMGMGGDDDGMMGGDDEMVTVHGTTDGGGEFQFSFNPETLGFGDDEMGGESDSGGEFGGHEGGHESHEGGEHEGGESHFGGAGMGGEEDDENPVAEGMMKKGKPGKGHRGARTSKMGIVPSNPASNHAAPFPTPQGSRQKRK